MDRELFSKILELKKRYGHEPPFGEVRRIFGYLRPFSHKKRLVHWDEQLRIAIGTEMRVGLKEDFDFRGARGRTLHDCQFFEVIVKKGDEIVEVVRRPIRRAFSQLVELTREIDLGVRIEEVAVPLIDKLSHIYRCDKNDYAPSTFWGKEVSYLLCYKCTDWIDWLYLYGENIKGLDEKEILSFIERVCRKKERNDAIIRKMKEIVAPYILAARL